MELSAHMPSKMSVGDSYLFTLEKQGQVDSKPGVLMDVKV